tara:strand:- start:1035 stop:1595 length:561 start_codon:yes stop_codon:yes gene_type:complete
MEIKEYIKVYEDVFPLKILSNMIRYLNTIEFEQGRILGDVVNKKIRNTEIYPLSRINKKMTDVHLSAVIQFVLTNVLNKYFKDLGTENNDWTRIIDLAFLKYTEGGFYKWHTDHCANIPRTLSAIFILNNDYEGGELCFKNPDGSGEFSINKKANSVVIWPSNFLYPHTVKPVTKGTRFSIVGWAL